MDIENKKTDFYRKNLRLEDLLSTLNNSLVLANKYPIEIKESYPIIFIIGLPRSGTTLLTQWLASLNVFCYPTNLISRFYKAPYIGALIQEMLVNPDYNYKNELFLEHKESFSSDVGKTSGISEPHEFWYYWREFFEFPEIPVAESKFLENADFSKFQEGIYKLQQIYYKPFFLKSLIANPYIKLFNENIEKPIFIHIQRDPIDNMRSLLNTRKKYFGDEHTWFSFKPKEFKTIEKLDPFSQVAAQVYFIDRDLKEQLSEVQDENKISIYYEEFCKDPRLLYDVLLTKLRAKGVVINAEYSGVNSFSVSRSSTMDADNMLKVYKDVLSRFENA